MKKYRLPVWKTVVARIMVVIVLIVLTAPSTTMSAAATPKLTKISADILEKGSLDLNVKNKIKNSTYTWSTSNQKVAAVDKNGVVKGIKKGTAVITCSIKAPAKTYKLTCKVNVRKAAASVKINNKVTAINLGQTYDLNRTLKPSTSNDLITWTSSNNKIAVPDKNGKFTALKTGTVKITAKSLRGKSDSVTIKVVDKDGTVTTQKELTALLGSGVRIITIKTEAAVDFTIPNGNYKKTALVVDAPNSEIHNDGIFASVTIKSVKSEPTPTPVPTEEKPTVTPNPIQTPTQTPTQAPTPTPTPTVAPTATPDPGDNTNAVSITFMDGSRVIQTITATKGEPLSQVPGTDKTAKKGYVFDGWYTNADFSTLFYADDEVKADKTVYAKYTALPEPEYMPTSFAQVDQLPGLTFEVIGGASAEGALAAVTLIPKDGSEVILLEVKTSANGIYTIGAKDPGFNEGSSYELTLADGYSFNGKPESIRTATFTIRKHEVQELSFSDDLVFLQTDDPETCTSVTYNGNASIGDIICLYKTTKPAERDYINGNYSDDPEVYVKVSAVSGTTLTLEPLTTDGMDEAKYTETMEKLYFMPDTFPLKVGALPTLTNGAGTVAYTALDAAARTIIGETAGNGKVEAGDFVAIYTKDFAKIDADADVILGEVTGYANGEITFKEITAQAMQDSIDMFLNQTANGDELLKGVDVDDLQADIEQEVADSGFAEDAAYLLAELASNTDGFKSLSNVRDIMITDESGQPLTRNEITLMGLGGTFTLSDNIKVKAEIETDKTKLHLGDGVRLAIGIDALFTVETDEGEIKIDISATFVEELAIGTDIKVTDKWKVYVFVPVLKSLRFDASIDVKNYTAVSVYVNVYTVEAEDEDIWTKVGGLLGDTKLGETFDKIQELESKISQAKAAGEQIAGYTEELAKLWDTIPSARATKEEWAAWGTRLGRTDITKDLLGLLNLTTETELDAGVEDVIKRYHEMMQTESNWIQLMKKRIVGYRTCVYGIIVDANVDFVVRADVNIALGTNLEYQVGKRHIFWFDVVKRTSGSSTMDLLDESFAFQFYVMGKLGLKMGIAAELHVSVIGLVGAGVTMEFGPYIKLYGLFVYEYSKYRPANTDKFTYKEQMYGGLYLDFGLYLIVGVNADALWGLFKWNKELLNKEYPLLTAGDRYFSLAFATVIEPDEVVRVIDDDGKDSNGITMLLPESYRTLEQLDFVSGNTVYNDYVMSNFSASFSNRNFSLDGNGKIKVTPPSGERYMTCDMTLTWKRNKLAFSNRDITIVIPLYWSNQSDKELSERYTAKVRVGNSTDGYTTVWSKRVQKGQVFDLPTADEIKSLIGYTGDGDLKYSAIGGYGGTTAGLTIVQDTTYEFNAQLKEYTLTVGGVQNADATQGSRTFTAKFGETFDLSSLVDTGANGAAGAPEDKQFTKFLNLTYNSDGKALLTEPIGRSLALSLQNNGTAAANYCDNSVLATFTFSGITADPVSVRMKAGTQPNDVWSAIAAKYKANVTNISPTVSKIHTNTDYIVTCTPTTGEEVTHTITFHHQDFSDYGNVGDFIYSAGEVKEYAVGSVITEPGSWSEDQWYNKPGYTFDQWYTSMWAPGENPAVDTAFIWGQTMPEEDLKLYGHWIPNTYKVTLDAAYSADKSGTFEDGDVTKVVNVTFGNLYGSLPTPQMQGFVFNGWFEKDVTNHERITSDTKVKIASDHTLHAEWTQKAVIDESTVKLITPGGTGSEVITAVYNPTVNQVILVSANDDMTLGAYFTVKYRPHGNGDWYNYTTAEVLDVGTYDIQVATDRDSEAVVYVEKTFDSGLVITQPQGYSLKTGYNYKVVVKTGNIADAGTDAKLYAAISSSSALPILTAIGYMIRETYRIDSGSSNGFERGDTDTCVLQSIDSLTLSPVYFQLSWEAKGSKPGWYCEWIEVQLFKDNGSLVSSSGPIPVGKWFTNENEAGHVTTFLTDFQFKRTVYEVGDFTESSNGLYTCGSISDTIRPEGYDAFAYAGAPKLTVDPEYARYVTLGNGTVTVNKAALFAEKGAETVNIPITVTFVDTMTEGTRIFMKTITVTNN